jgi:uncharacterized protein YjbI with pentapeptide repeats
VGIVIALGVLAFVIYAPKLPFLLSTDGMQPAERANAQSDFRGHLIQAFGGVVLALGAYYTARTFALNREGQITERFTRAVEQFGDRENLDVRLGGIYALERIAHDSKTLHEPVMEVLTAFLRERGQGQRPELAPALDNPECPVDSLAAATVIARRNRGHERADYRLDLRSVDLRGASLIGAHLERTDLREADLSGANVEAAHLEGAELGLAHLEGARLRAAHLEGARLRAAHLEGANLALAPLERADLPEAHLERANLTAAHLEGAVLEAAHLEGALLFGAFLEGAHLGAAHLEGAHLGVAHLEGVNLSSVDGLTSEQLEEAYRDENTRLPDYLLGEVGE